MARSRITRRFAELRKNGAKAFVPYVMAGDPSLERTVELVGMFERLGADVVELGVPFSDPLADGPVIQSAAERALQRGVTLKEVIATVREIRKHSEVPIALMTYYNPVYKYGVEKFVRDASKAGVDGVIVPDLPPDEARALIGPARKYGVDTIFLIAPTSTYDRMKLVAKASTGFIYYVSITGITGAKLSIGDTQRDSIAALRELTDKPIAVGFGVSRPEEAAEVAALADGVIVGSAIVKKIAGGASDRAIGTLMRGLRRAIK